MLALKFKNVYLGNCIYLLLIALLSVFIPLQSQMLIWASQQINLMSLESKLAKLVSEELFIFSMHKISRNFDIHTNF